jgi:hypothetical protein
MTRNDIKIYDPIEPKYTTSTLIASNASANAVLSGVPTKVSSSGYVVAMVDADGTNGIRFAGLAKSDSTETTVVDGRVTLWLPMPGMVYSGTATTAANADTQAEIDALYYKRVIFDVTSNVFTVDTGATDAATNSLIIIGGDYQTSKIYFVIGSGGSILQ